MSKGIGFWGKVIDDNGEKLHNVCKLIFGGR